MLMVTEIELTLLYKYQKKINSFMTKFLLETKKKNLVIIGRPDHHQDTKIINIPNIPASGKDVKCIK